MLLYLKYHNASESWRESPQFSTKNVCVHWMNDIISTLLGWLELANARKE